MLPPPGVLVREDELEAPEMALCGVFVKQYRLKVGWCAPQHAHDYDHVTALAAGIIDVWCDGVYIGRREAPTLIGIKAGTKHMFQAVVDDCILLCIHPLDDGQTRPAVRERHVLEHPDAH